MEYKKDDFWYTPLRDLTRLQLKTRYSHEDDEKVDRKRKRGEERVEPGDNHEARRDVKLPLPMSDQWCALARDLKELDLKG